VPRAKQKLRDVQEVLAERETQIGLYYGAARTTPPPLPAWRRWSIPTRSTPRATRPCWASAMPMPARPTHPDRPTFPAPSRSGCAPSTWTRPPQAYAKVITRYPMAPHVEDARDRLVAMNRPVPEPTQEAVAENDAEERSRQPLHFTDKTSTSSSTGPRWWKPCTWANPRSTIPSGPWRRTSPGKTSLISTRPTTTASRPGAPSAPVAPTGVNEPPRSDQPNSAPLQLPPPRAAPEWASQIVSAPSGTAADPNAVIKPVGPDKTVLPAAEKPAEAPGQVNDIKPGATATPPQPTTKVEEAQGRF
jgi:outer membrane protein assembly factor BamD